MSAQQTEPRTPGRLEPVGSADWQYRTSSGINIWTLEARRGLKFMVTQNADNVQAHVTTGEAHKYTSTIGSYATVAEARQRCVDLWQNDKVSDGGGQ